MDVLTVGSQRLVHLDFKGAPPKISYLDKIFPLLRDWGATGLLIEWEDTFPYKDNLIEIGGLSLQAETTGAPYSLAEVNQILDLAACNFLNVVPLVQTFGHLEFVLKHEKWRGLREVEAYPSSMCPSHPESLSLARDMVTQIIRTHPNIQYIHIGADEVWHIGLCPTCEKRAQDSKYGKATLFLEHIVNLCQYIKEQYPSMKIIVWDDMLRNVETSVLQDFDIGGLVEPMVWHYNSAEIFHLGPALWDKYSNIFPNIWAATAFKGASGCTKVLPANKYHVTNHEAWLSELSTNANKIQHFRGACFTGWSRYDHYAILCELLPCALPTLALCLKVWLTGGYNQDILGTVGKSLGYMYPSLSLDDPIRPVQLPSELSFPGWQILVGMDWFLNVKTKYKNLVESDQLEAWFNSSQVNRNYTNPMQIERFIGIFTDLLFEICSLERFLRIHLDTIFYPNVGDEIIESRISSMKEHITQLKADCETQVSLGCRPHPTLTRVLTRQI